MSHNEEKPNGAENLPDKDELFVGVNLHSDHEKRGAEWISVAEKAFEAKQMKNHFAAIEEELLKELKEHSEDISSKGGGYRFTATDCKGKVNYSKIAVLKGMNLDKYRKAGFQRWKLTKI